METETKVKLDLPQLESWKKEGREHLVNIQGNDGQSSRGQVFVRKWTSGERLRRALMWGGLFWIIAIFCVLIPILHFVLVPTFLILGPVMAVIVHKQESVVLGGYGTCPRCHKTLPIEKAKPKWPISDLCTECHNAVKITLAD